jgi:hypothetical protein
LTVMERAYTLSPHRAYRDGSPLQPLPQIGIVEPEGLRCVNKLQETWNGISELLEELNAETLEARGSAVRA